MSVLVAAKDEEDNIETCITTLLTQDYPNFEVIAINDRSTDGTADILERLVANNPGAPKLTALHVRALREGWFGKNNAMRTGIELADGEWYCFTDADCRQISNKTLSVAWQFAHQNKIDFLSVLPVLEAKSFWERVIQPVCAAIMALWFNPCKVNDPNSSASYANGAFMLMRRDIYQAIGGHERVKTEVNEDMHMARLAKEAGHRLFVIQNDDLYRVRMYSSFKETWRGWSRIFYGCFGTFKRLIISTVLLCVASILPWASLLAGAIGWLFSAADSWRMIALFGGAAVISQLVCLFRFYRLCQIRTVLLPTYILGAVIALGMLISAMMKLSGRTTTTWRGTTYRGSQVAAHALPPRREAEQGNKVART
jgi:glycosyltransferase involved in cell wall biosynthesis